MDVVIELALNSCRKSRALCCRNHFDLFLAAVDYDQCEIVSGKILPGTVVCVVNSSDHVTVLDDYDDDDYHDHQIS